MMTRPMIAALRPIGALAALLAGCGSPPSQPANVAGADDYAQRIRALPEGQRDGVLLRAIRDANRECQHVTKSTAIPDVGGAPAWTATCDSGATWVVALNPGGIATVTNAAELVGAPR